MAQCMPYDPVRNSTHASYHRPQGFLPPIMASTQQRQLPALSTIMSPARPRDHQEDSPMMEYDSAYAGTSEFSTPERESAHAGRKVPRTNRRADKAGKQKDDRALQASYFQLDQDVLMIVGRYAPKKHQTKANGRNSGLVVDKIELAAVRNHVLSWALKKLLVPAAAEGHEAHSAMLDELRQVIDEGRQVHDEGIKSNLHGVPWLHEDHLFAGVRDELCAVVDQPQDPLCGACSVHTDAESRQRSKGADGVPDFIACRLSRREQAYNDNFRRLVDQAKRSRQRQTPVDSWGSRL